MKRILSFAVALAATATAMAQNIAVVSPSNETDIYQTLDEAITNATDGSVIYLPGGGFTISDNTKINKRLTIMGVSHRGDTDNADGASIISGKLQFDRGSSGSAVIGAYISGNVEIDSVQNITVRKCNAYSIQVKNSGATGLVVNQCYLREDCNFGNCNVRMENNIIDAIYRVVGGIIKHNIITGVRAKDNDGRSPWTQIQSVSASVIEDNFFLNWSSGAYYINNCVISHNCIGQGEWGDEPYKLDEGVSWDNVFNQHKGCTTSSDYSLKGSWGKGEASDGSDIGIFGGSGFDPYALAPIPRIVSKKVDEQTDGTGRLHIEVTVKSN
ncbi:MAG: hypothetical protein IJ176_06405 [Prevotella sp.]|nr:hypothetical protein [Prevotella sp.]